jgi:hypothetical protein
MRARGWFVAGAALTLLGFGCKQIEFSGVTLSDGGGGSVSESCPCAGPLPAGWIGPIAVFEGGPGTSPSCPEAFPIPILKGGTGFAPSPATCAACTCSAPQVTCSPGAVVTHNHSGCNGSSTNLSPIPGDCNSFTPGSDGVEVDPPTSNVGSCSPAGGQATLPPLFATEAVACGLPAGAPCPGGSTCPSPPGPFEARTCVFTHGNQPCPTPYTMDRAWSSASDTRKCSPCSCGDAGASGCTVTTTVYSDAMCSTNALVLAVGQCLSPQSAQSLRVTTTMATPTCVPGGGAPSGSAVEDSSLTVCCMP